MAKNVYAVKVPKAKKGERPSGKYGGYTKSQAAALKKLSGPGKSRARMRAAGGGGGG